jgi:threonine dehydrogenase-like Zn-dependent dehydrogenase
MKQIVAVGPKHNVIKEVPMPEMTDNHILIRNLYVGVCMSEHYDWSTAPEGFAFGHEPMGVIEAVGKNVTGYEVGQKVTGTWGSALPGTGGMTEYAVADPSKPGTIIVPVPENLRDVDFVVEPLQCMISAASKAKVNVPGTEVCIVGAGYMGCGVLSLLKLRGCFVTAVDPRPESRENAKKYGADYVYSVEEMEEKLANGFEGFDVVMEWAESDESLDLAARLTKECGQLCIGAYHTGGNRSVGVQLLNVRAIDCISVHPRELDLNKTAAFNAAKLLSSGQWCYKNVPTKIYPMSKFDEAQADLETKYGKYMKALIDMTKIDGEPYIV